MHRLKVGLRLASICLAALLACGVCSTAFAAPTDPGCDAKAAARTLRDASPQQVASAFTKLAACDPEAAKKVAPSRLPDVLAGSDASEALVAAVRVGAGGAVRSWVDAAEPDVRSRMVGKLGKACAEEPAMAPWFVQAAADLGDTFFEQRWHRALATCRTAEVRTVLSAALESRTVGRPSRNESSFVSVLEIYARNLGVDALPKIGEYLSAPRNAQEAVLLVNTLADAANVGGAGGTDAAVADKAAKLLFEKSVFLPEKAFDAARRTLVALGSPDRASALAAIQYKDRMMSNTLRYAAAAVEVVTCKNGTKRARLHVGPFTEDGNLQPDELQERLLDKLISLPPPAYEFDLASTCKGTRLELQATMPNAPFASQAEQDAWISGAINTFEERFADIWHRVVAEDGFGW